MNFEFLKDLRGLSGIYKKCSNAEKLAITMPEQSVFTSRKSAELLAKFIYMNAHNQEMEGMTFADILSDVTFRRFINNRDMINAFHYIRKTGNKAVHGEEEETSEEAVDVLHDLHYVAGETARILGLIDDYPSFKENLEEYHGEQYIDQDDIDSKAREMFIEYIEEYNAQQERDKYIEQEDYDLLSYAIEGNVELHECLEFEKRPRLDLMEEIQNYLLSLLQLSKERSPEKAKELGLNNLVTLDIRISIDGEEYSSDDSEQLKEIILRLSEAHCSVIDCYCNGVLREFFHDEFDENDNPRINMIRKDTAWTGSGMLDILEAYKRRNSFVYKLVVFYPDSGEHRHVKILNGKDVDVLSAGTTEIINKEFDEEWHSDFLDLWADFDCEKYSDQLKKIQEIIRTSLPKSEVADCEKEWENGELHVICSNTLWNCRRLKEVQRFLDRINEVLLPIKDEIDAGGSGIWEIKSEFAVATWDWTDEGFKITGCCY